MSDFQTEWEAMRRHQLRERAARERELTAEPLAHRRAVAERIKREVREAHAASNLERELAARPRYPWQD
jgi:hypothetical protein